MTDNAVSLLYVTGREGDEATYSFASVSDMAEWEADTTSIKWMISEDVVDYAQWLLLVEAHRTKFGDHRVPNDIHESYDDVMANAGVQIAYPSRPWGTVPGTKPSP